MAIALVSSVLTVTTMLLLFCVKGCSTDGKIYGSGLVRLSDDELAEIYSFCHYNELLHRGE